MPIPSWFLKSWPSATTPTPPVYVAKVIFIAAESVSAQQYGCTTPDLARTVFRPCWHFPNENDIALSETTPAGLIPCLGEP
jgi:hypothetical protein